MMTAPTLTADLLRRGVMRAADGDWLHRPIDQRPRSQRSYPSVTPARCSS